MTAHGRVRAGDWLAVHGCGGVGLSAVMIASALGARVIAVDVAAAALDRARELGAEFAVLAGPSDPVTAIGEVTGGGAHVRSTRSARRARAGSVRCLRRRGRHVQVGLLLGAAVAPPIPMDMVIGRELEIYGSHGMAARDYPAMMAMVADGVLRPGRLIGEVIRLEDVAQALAAMDGLDGRSGGRDDGGRNDGGRNDGGRAPVVSGGSAPRPDPRETFLHGFRNWRQPPGRVVWPTSIRYPSGSRR